MSSLPDQLARTERFVNLQARGRDLMMRAMPGVVNDDVIASLRHVVAEGERIAQSADPGDQLTPRQMVDEFVADMTEWTARAFDSMGQADEALDYYGRAAEQYTRLGNQQAVHRVKDKAGEVRLHAGQDIDAEFQRLQGELDEAPTGSFERARILVSLGELASHAGDDHGALKWLREAEQILSSDRYRLPDAGSVLGALGQSLAAIEASTSTGQPSEIETAMALRALHQRLYFALSNAHRLIDPDKSAEYGGRVEKMDADRPSAGSREELLAMMKKLLG